jgi:hypothetical protein
MNLVWENAPYKDGALLVLLALADWSDDKGRSFPSVPTLAAKTRQSERNTQYCLRDLEKAGFLSRKSRAFNSNLFTIDLEKLGASRLDMVKPIAPIRRVKQVAPGEAHCTEVVQPSSPGVVQLATIPGEVDCTVSVTYEPSQPSPSLKPIVPPKARDGRTQEKPLRNVNSKTAKSTGQTRHTRIHEMIMAFYIEWTGQVCPWGPPEGKNLKTLLDRTPDWRDEQIAQCLDNMSRSDVSKSLCPYEWLVGLPKYLNGPLDRYGKPINHLPELVNGRRPAAGYRPRSEGGANGKV